MSKLQKGPKTELASVITFEGLTSTQIQAHHISRSGDPASESGVTQKVMGKGLGTTSGSDPTQKGKFLSPASEHFF